jgi:hypothetical protein
VVRTLPLTLALLLACVVTAVGFHWNTRVGGGSDSHGYVSQADLWRSGRLTIEQPWAASLPMPNAHWAAAPLGWRPRIAAGDAGFVDSATTIVPKYPPGLPLLMALGKTVAGQPGVFAIGPLAGGLLMLAIFGMGKRLGMPWAGVLAGWLVATSPAFLFMLVQPMSDVPVTLAWAVAFWCLLGAGARAAWLGGAAAAVALMIRPNLVPLVAVIGVWLLARALAERRGDWRRHAARLAAFAAGVAPGVVAIAALNAFWYASPFNSGYEPLHDLFKTGHFAGNVGRYVRWFVDTQTPVALLGFLALCLPAVWRTDRGDARWTAALFAGVVAAVWLIYFFYVPFDDWAFLRFLLPTWPLILLGLAALLTRRALLRRRVYAAALIVVVIALGMNGVRVARDRSAFDLREGEAKYVSVARLTRQETGRSAVVLAMQHSGSLRYYGGLLTLQWNWVPPHRLDLAAAWFNERGMHPYALLEEWEVKEFRQHFSPDSTIGRLEMAPVMQFEGPTRLFLYDLLKGPSTNPQQAERSVKYETHLRDWPGPVAPPRVSLR